MHPAFARFVPQSASETMSSLANLASLARSKLRSTHASGARDNLSLHRWVLLKNSITTQPTDHSHTSSREHDVPCADDACSNAQADGVSVEVHAVDAEPEFEEEEVGLDSIIDEGMFAFLFPDPGDAVAATDEASASEEQWLDSILQTLGDDEDAYEVDLDASLPSSSSSSQSSTLLELDDSAASLPPSTPSVSVTCPVPYPVCRPPFVRPFDLECRDFCFASHLVRPYAVPYDDLDEEEECASSVPDAIEDTSDDETDRDSLSTPYSRSQSSLNLVDPALVPLPRDGPEPHIYSASYDDFRAFESDPLPYHDYNSDSTPVYSPYRQTC